MKDIPFVLFTNGQKEKALAEYTIPDPERVRLNNLRQLPDSVLEPFISALEESPDEVPEIGGLSRENAAEIKEAVLDLYRVREFFDAELVEFSQGIAEGLQEAVGFPESEVPQLAARIQRLLTLTPLGLAAKAQSLKLEYERRLCSARILTDARPVYVYSPAGRPEAVIITHTLRITYHDDTSAMREIYIQMDPGDLAELRKVLDRAEAKAKSFESVFAAANVPVLAS